jgi:hypothetical protein
MMALILGGIYAGLSMRREFFPEIDPEAARVELVYPGATPRELEESMARKVVDATGAHGVMVAQAFLQDHRCMSERWAVPLPGDAEPHASPGARRVVAAMRVAELAEVRNLRRPAELAGPA